MTSEQGRKCACGGVQVLYLRRISMKSGSRSGERSRVSCEGCCSGCGSRICGTSATPLDGNPTKSGCRYIETRTRTQTHIHTKAQALHTMQGAGDPVSLGLRRASQPRTTRTPWWLPAPPGRQHQRRSGSGGGGGGSSRGRLARHPQPA